MSDLENFFRRLEILRYLGESPHPRSEADIRWHLEEQGAFNIADPDKTSTEQARKKKVQRDLKDLWNASSHNPEATARRDILPIQNTFLQRHGNQREGYAYSIVARSSADSVQSDAPRPIPGRPSVPQALALTLTHQFLTDFIPVEHYEALSNSFQLARETLEKRRNPNEDWSRVPGRVAIFQRGQRLTPPPFDEEKLNTIYHAIAEGKCVEGHYLGVTGDKHTVLSPYGVVFRLPKIYLVATKKSDPDGAMRQYLVHRFRDLALSPEKSDVPRDFKLMPWLESGGMDVAVSGEQGEDHPRYDVKIKLYHRSDGRPDNMIRDLSESRLAENQIGPEDQGDGASLLTLPDTRITYQLMEWILGRGDRVEVLEPQVLRDRIVAHLAHALGRYKDSPQRPD